jgi:imidazolonepropionase-like amidohydrolase
MTINEVDGCTLLPGVIDAHLDLMSSCLPIVRLVMGMQGFVDLVADEDQQRIDCPMPLAAGVCRQTASNTTRLRRNWVARSLTDRASPVVR